MTANHFGSRQLNHPTETLKKSVVPAKAGIHALNFFVKSRTRWIPAFAGMTARMHLKISPSPFLQRGDLLIGVHCKFPLGKRGLGGFKKLLIQVHSHLCSAQ